MTTEPKTIDNLGAKASVRYAESQRDYDPTLWEGAPSIHSEVYVTKPYAVSDFEKKFNTTDKNKPWAHFPEPPTSVQAKRRLFGSQLTPLLGSLSEQEELMNKIKESSIKRSQSETLESKYVESEKKSLLSCLEKLHYLDKLLTDVNTKKNQYHKG